jgi:hypothetical protein
MTSRDSVAGKRGGPTQFGARFPTVCTSYEGLRAGVCNLLRRLKAAGSLSFFPLVPACKQASGSIFDGLFVAPAFLSVPVFHAHNKAWSKQHGAPRNSASGA